jgi:hypothetical protein
MRAAGPFVPDLVCDTRSRRSTLPHDRGSSNSGVSLATRGRLLFVTLTPALAVVALFVLKRKIARNLQRLSEGM